MQINRLLLFCLLVFIANNISAQYDKPYVDSLENELKNNKYDSAKVRCLIKIGMYYAGENPVKAKDYFIKAYNYKISFSKTEQGYKTLAATNLARNYTALNDSANTAKWIYLSLQHAAKTDYALAIDLAYEQAGIYYLNSSVYDSAIYYNQQMVNLWDSLKRPEKTTGGYYGMANIFQNLHQYNKAIFYLKRIIKVGNIDENGNDPQLISIYSTLAEIYLVQNKYDSVVHYCNKAIPIAYYETYYQGVIEMLATKGTALTHLKKYNEALTAAKEGYNLAKQNEHISLLPKLDKTIAIAFAHTSKKDSAIFYAKEAEAIAEQSTTTTQQDWGNVYEMWADVYEQLGDYKLAYENKQKELAILQKLKDDEIAQATAQSEVKFETNKKEQQIVALNEVTAQQKKINWLMAAGLLLAVVAAAFAYTSYRSKRKAALVLEQSNKEKEVFLKEIHHRVKNNLQIISSLLYMQFKDAQDVQMIEKLKQAQQRIKSMALVHNKLYEKQDVVHVYLKDYINDLAKGILQSNNPDGKNINLNITGKDDVSLNLDTSISVGLILNELITNSCKYAFANKQQGNIDIDIQQNDNIFVLKIKDDGEGLPQNFEQKNSLGVRLIKNLARQLQGCASFENNNGTIVNIEFKEAA